MQKINLPFYAKLAFVLISLSLIIYIALLGEEILGPLLFSFLFSVLLLPVAGFLERMHLPRSLAALISVIFLVLLTALLLYFVATQLSSLMQDWPLLKKQIADSLAGLQQWIARTFHIEASKQLDYINPTSSEGLSTATSLIGHTVLSLSSTLLFLIFIPIYTFFLLFYRHLLVRFILSLFAEKHSQRVYEVLHQVQSIIKSYVIGLFIEMCAVALISCAIFWIIGVKYATLLGVLTGLFNLIPYVGIFTAIALCMLITFASGSVSKVLIVGLCLWLLHVMDSNLLMPRIVGSKVRINALITIIGVITGNLVWGIAGMFLAIPSIAILKIIFDHVEELKPWGILLGDDTQKKLPVIGKIKIIKK